MRNIDRIEPFLETVRSVWEEHPDMRLGQILSVAACHAGWPSFDLFYIEDAKLHEGLIKLYAESLRRRGYERMSGAE